MQKIEGSILIVEDNPVLAMELEMIFEDVGLEIVGPAATVRHALELLENTNPSYATVDFNLGHETGETITERLRTKDVPFVCITGEPEVAAHRCQLQPNQVLSKPFMTQDILQALIH